MRFNFIIYLLLQPSNHIRSGHAHRMKSDNVRFITIAHMPEVNTALRKELGLRDLVLFNIAALISTRWIGIAAHVGPGTIVLWILAAALLLVPCAFVVANLSRKF